VFYRKNPDHARLFTFKAIVSAVAALAVGLSVFLAYTNFKYAGTLAEARAQVVDKVLEAKAANARTARALLTAAEATSNAKHASKIASIEADKARALRVQLQAIRQAGPTGSTTDTAIAEADAWKSAFEHQLVATAHLQVAVDTLTNALNNERAASAKLQAASTRLVTATKRSFWSRFIPKLAINATVGVDPLQPEQGIKKVVGIGGSWVL
jgi:DNA-directed RNA polymerase subunit F